ncbi:MAG: VWA domain-containing protein [Deltaproteobacteria bacterium]|nr:VWA domain-containing protein [Deltaproteobacteria bacterium]
MRKSLLFVAPLALAAAIPVAACGSDNRAGFTPDATDSGGQTSGFVPVDAGAKETGEGCSESKTEILRVPVVIEFAVDDSGSMDGTGASDKWGAARDALMAAFADMQTTGDPGLFVGLLRWSTNVGNKVSPGQLTTASHFTALNGVINTPKACPPCSGGGTSMLNGMNAAYGELESFTPPKGFVVDQTKRVLVLVSDGVPAESEKPQCENLADTKLNLAAPKGPILTFTVGIGPFPTTSTSTYDPAFMSRIAQKGGTAPTDCSPNAGVPEGLCHFQVTPGGSDSATAKAALIAAINKIRVLSASCEFSFTTNANTDLSNVKVELTDKDGNKTPIPKDDKNGWSFDDPNDPTKVILHGDACSTSSGTVSGRVDVVIGCRSAN